MADNKKRILVVDDEQVVRESLQVILSKYYQVSAAADGQQALAVLTQGEQTLNSEDGETSSPDLVLLDVLMPGIDGLELLKQIRTSYPSLPVIMLTASKTVKTVVNAMKIGAVDYLNKPFEVDELVSLIDDTLVNRGLDSIEEDLIISQVSVEDPQIPGDLGAIVGRHPLMQELYHKVEQLAKRNTTVLITGESGTGKEMIAREIHRMSSRAKGPFIALNCSAIPETLIESELFGHEKGAFTHAVEKRIGQFELAHQGTLFLDEIGELSLQVQVKMLRFLQDQQFYRVGRSRPISVDVRILAATNRSLEMAIQEGQFRQDLYYRINVVSLEMPPLRSRKEDIEHLVKHFIEKLSQHYGHKKAVLTADALTLLKHYSWPGNVRELENLIESVLALSSSEQIRAADLPARLRGSSENSDLKVDVLNGSMQFEAAERAFETELIMKALINTGYVQTRAAEMLGISRRILKYKMDKLGISDSPAQVSSGSEVK